MRFNKIAIQISVCALFLAAAMPLAEFLRPALAQSNGSGATDGSAQVTGIRIETGKDSARILLDLSRETKFEMRELQENPAKGMPARVYVDLQGANLALASKEPIAVDNGLLRQVRVGQYSANVVRVVLDMNQLWPHNAFTLANPSRLVIDVLGKDSSAANPPRQAVAAPLPASPPVLANVKRPGAALPVNGLRKIVLDPGHGGKDPGAIGVGGVAEKDVVLSIARKLARKLREELHVEVVLTRNDDRFVALEDRTATANRENADLFISLHMNASANSDARGLETYYLDNTSDEAAIRLAARENSTSRRNISDLQFILSDMTQNMKLEDSITLAHRLQGAVVDGMAKTMGDVKDLGVKKALFYVLVGARMPSVLVEMFFITNRNEGRAMSRAAYQDAIVESLYSGIQKYGESNMMAKTL